MSAEPKPIRSPSYPVLPLRSAVAAVGKIENLYRSSPVDRAHAAKIMGYSSLSGPANQALAALSAYGLLERAGKGETRVTELARDILHADSDDQRKASLVEAAMVPKLYRELRDRFSGIPVPPEDGVINYLNRQEFNPNSVRSAAKAFLETMRFLEELGANDSHGASAGAVENPGPEPSFQEPRPMNTPDPQRPPPAGQVHSSQKGTLQEVFNLEEGPVVLTIPSSLSAESYEDLEAQFQLFLRRVKRRVVKTDEAAG